MCTQPRLSSTGHSVQWRPPSVDVITALSSKSPDQRAPCRCGSGTTGSAQKPPKITGGWRTKRPVPGNSGAGGVSSSGRRRSSGGSARSPCLVAGALRGVDQPQRAVGPVAQDRVLFGALGVADSRTGVLQPRRCGARTTRRCRKRLPACPRTTRSRARRRPAAAGWPRGTARWSPADRRPPVRARGPRCPPRSACGALTRAARRPASSRIPARLDQAAGVGHALAGDVERGAVVHRGAQHRQPQRDVDAA